MVFKQTANSSVKRAVLSIAVDAAVVNGAELPRGWKCQPTCPDCAVVILEHLGTNVLTRKLRVLGEFSVFQTHKSFRGANPKRPVVCGEQAENTVGREMLTRRRLPDNTPDAIEAHQAELRTQPEITIGRLRNGEDGAFNKAVADLPPHVRVLADIECRVQRERTRTTGQQQTEHDRAYRDWASS